MKYIKKIPIMALLMVLVLSTALPVYAKEGIFKPTRPPEDGFIIPTPKPKTTVKKKTKFPESGIKGSWKNPFTIKKETVYNTKTWEEKAQSAAEGATSGDKYQYTLLKSRTEEDVITVRSVDTVASYSHVYSVTRVSDIYVKGKKVTTKGSSKYVYSDWTITGVDSNGSKIDGGFRYKTKGESIGTGQLRSSAETVQAYFFTPGTYTITTLPYMKQTTSSKEQGYGIHYYRKVNERYDNHDFELSPTETSEVSYVNTSPETTSTTAKEDFRETWTIVVTADMVVPDDPSCTGCPPVTLDPKNPSNKTPGKDDIDVGINE